MDRRAKRQRHAQEVAQRAAYLAQREQSNEQHVHTVIERSSDARFVQREATETGVELTFDAESPANARLRRLLSRRKQAFRERFGREPNGSDPLFFDSAPGSPSPLTTEAVVRALRDPALADQLGLEPALLATIADLGYAVSDENRHLFSAHEVSEFQAALSRNRASAEGLAEPE